MFDRSSGRLLIQEVVACGTEDVLTCHVIIMREPATGVTAIAHFDEFSRVWDFREMAEDFIEKVKCVKHKSEWEYADDGGEDVELFEKNKRKN